MMHLIMQTSDAASITHVLMQTSHAASIMHVTIEAEIGSLHML